jgi:hypothetical protein
VRALLSEFCRYCLHTTWYAYPQELPADVLAEKQEYGRLDRNLMLPLEDLSAGWDQVGRIGQQVYGANAAFVYLVGAYHRPERVPFILFVDVPVEELQPEDGRLMIRLRGDGRFPARIRLIPEEGHPLPEIGASIGAGHGEKPLEGSLTKEGHREFLASGDATLTITW